MLLDHQYPIPQREPLIGIIRDRRVQRCMADSDASRRRNHPANMLIRLIPHLDPERGDCAGYRASLDWPAVAEVHRRGNF